MISPCGLVFCHVPVLARHREPCLCTVAIVFRPEWGWSLTSMTEGCRIPCLQSRLSEGVLAVDGGGPGAGHEGLFQEEARMRSSSFFIWGTLTHLGDRDSMLAFSLFYPERNSNRDASLRGLLSAWHSTSGKPRRRCVSSSRDTSHPCLCSLRLPLGSGQELWPSWSFKYIFKKVIPSFSPTKMESDLIIFKASFTAASHFLSTET